MNIFNKLLPISFPLLLIFFLFPVIACAQDYSDWGGLEGDTLHLPIWGKCNGPTCIHPTTLPDGSQICPLPEPGGGGAPPVGDGTLNCADIPPELRAIFEDASKRYGVDAALIAAIFAYGENGGSWPVEGPWPCSYAGACGPFQFMPGTWDAYGVDGNGDGAADINNLQDAAVSAANYLCASGACSGDFSSAIYAYNNADWYVYQVMNGYNHIKECMAGGG